MLKKTKLFFVVACLLLSFAQATPNKTFAAEMTSQSQSTVKNDYTTIKTYVQKFFNSHNGKGTLNDPIELYNLNNNLQALFFSSNSGGYLIVNLADYTIPEFSPVDKNSFITVNGKKHFYNGPLSYLEEDNNGQVIDSKTKQNRGSLKNLKDHDIFQKRNNNRTIKSSEHLIPPENSDLFIGSNTILSANSLSDLSGNYAVTSAVTPTVISITKSYTIKNQLSNYLYNPDGRCFVTASAMMLDYYDRYYNNNFIPSDLESPTGRALIDYIVANYIPTNSSSGAQLTGLQNYVNARNVGYTVDQTPLKYDPISGYYTFDPTIAANSINSDKPFIVQLTNDSVSKDGSLKFGNHEVAAYGYATVQYDTNSSPNYMYTIVNDGWGHTSVWIDKRYQTYLTYIR